jgi:hypothetical protein
MADQFPEATKMVFPPNDLSHLSDEEFNALAPQGYHATGPAEPLSPAAQAVMIAAANGNFNVVNDPVYKQCIAAALRAAADQVVAMRPHGGRAWTTEQATAYDALTKVADHHLAIAAELDSTSITPLEEN